MKLRKKILQGTHSKLSEIMLFIYEFLIFFHIQTQSIRKPPGDGKTLCYLIISKINFGQIKSIIMKLVYRIQKKCKVIRTEF